MTAAPLPAPDCIDGCPHPRDTVQVYGHGAAQAQIAQAALSGTLHHAWMLTGPQGIGKATLAYQAARFLLAEDRAAPPTADAALGSVPMDHPVARRIAAGSEPGLFVLRRPMDDKGEKWRAVITVDETRKLKHFFAMAAGGNGRRVVIVDAVDDLNPSAANALLKLLEEPPKDAVLLLITHQPAQILPTIRSRCRVLPLRPLSDTDMQAALAQALPEEGFEGSGVLALAQGSVGQAARLSLSGGMDLYAQLVDVLGGAGALDRQKCLALATGVRGKDAGLAHLAAMIGLLLSRLARSGLVPSTEACLGERALFTRLAPNATAARAWATLQQSIERDLSHGISVNLDPHAMILDMIFKIEQTAAKVT